MFLVRVLFLLNVGAAAQFGRDAVEFLATDHDHLQRRDVGEAEREVRQVVLMDEESFQLLQPAETHTYSNVPTAADLQIQ